MVTVRRHERFVHYRHGALIGVLEPGRHRFWSTGNVVKRVDTRIQLFEVRPQEVPTSDGISVKVSVAARLTIVDPVAYLEYTSDPHGYVYDAIKSWLRDAVHSRTLDEVVAGITVEETPSSVVAAATDAGFDITEFGVRDVLIPGEIRRAAEELVTTRQRAAIALEQARSEIAVLRALANSAKVLEDHPALAAIRLAETAASHGGTVIIERPAT
jgi:regulator of protease activity HflC (stomatin/prohibitin superfamily)